MDRRLALLIALGLTSVTGCASSSPSAKIDEAAKLVEQRTGHAPEWIAPWDAAPPAWDSRSVLTCDQAVVMALRNNRELRADLALIGQANADLVQAGLMQNPVINLMAMFPSGGGRAMLRSLGLPMQPIQDLWLIPVRKKVAQAALQQTVLRAADRAVETAANVKKVYARLQYSQRALELIHENMNVVEQSTGIIRVRQTAGQATQVDVNLFRIRYLRLKSELVQMEAEYHSAQRELLMLMGLAAAGDAWKVEPVSETKDPLEPPEDESQLLVVAAEQRLDLKAAEWQAESAASNIQLMTREALWFPGLALGLGVERSPAPRSNNPKLLGQAGNIAARGLTDRLTGMQSPIMLPAAFSPTAREAEWTVGPMLEMKLPIFDQGQGKIGRALYEYRQRIAEYEAKCQDVTRMVRDSAVMYRQAYDQVRFYREAIMPEVERNLQLAQQSYVAGQEDLTIFLNVQEDLILTRLKILEYFRDSQLRRAELERQAGGALVLPAPATQPGS